MIEIVSGEAATANVAAEPLFLMFYGPPGLGKTTDAVQAFGRRAFFVSCEEGALKPILARGLPMPDHPKDVVKTWDDLVAAVSYAAQHKDRYSAVIIDTISTWTANVYRSLEDNFKGKNRWDLPVQMRKMLLQLREGARALGIHVVMIAHQLPPQYTELGALRSKGGPLLAPKTAMEIFNGVCDTQLRVDIVNTGMQNQRVYFTGGPEWPISAGLPPTDLHLWHVKNRDGVAAAIVPADLKAYLTTRQPPYGGL